MISRPLAAFTDPAPMPPSTSNPTTVARDSGGSSAVPPTTTPVIARPAAIGHRSPIRSTTAPHATSVSNSPAVGAATTTPTAASERPRVSRSVGTRKGMP